MSKWKINCPTIHWKNQGFVVLVSILELSSTVDLVTFEAHRLIGLFCSVKLPQITLTCGCSFRWLRQTSSVELEASRTYIRKNVCWIMSAIQLSFLYMLAIIVVMSFISEVSSFSPSIGIQQRSSVGINSRSLNVPLSRVEVGRNENYYGLKNLDTFPLIHSVMSTACHRCPLHDILIFKIVLITTSISFELFWHFWWLKLWLMNPYSVNNVIIDSNRYFYPSWYYSVF